MLIEEEKEDSVETYSYQGSEVIIVTVFSSNNGNIAIIEDINTGEQYEVFMGSILTFPLIN